MVFECWVGAMKALWAEETAGAETPRAGRAASVCVCVCNAASMLNKRQGVRGTQEEGGRAGSGRPYVPC